MAKIRCYCKIINFSEDAEESWAKMKEAVKVSLFNLLPEILRVHGLN